MWQPNLAGYAGPKYKALADAISDAILKGELASEVKLPPQRRLADALGVTVGTVTRAYALVEQRGHVEARVGSGTYVCPSKTVSQYALNHDPDKIDFATCRAPQLEQARMMAIGFEQLSKSPDLLVQLGEYQVNPPPYQLNQYQLWLEQQGVVFASGEAPSELHFSYGGQHAIYAYLSATCRPGDSIVCEALCYPGVVKAAQRLGLKILSVEMDEQGMVPDKLSSLCKQQKPKCMYVTPNNQNPTCAAMSLQRRQELIAVAQQYDVAIIEDEVNFCTVEHRLPTLQSLAPERVTYISSFSKRFMAGLRIGMLVTPNVYALAVKQALHANTWMVSPFMFELGYQWLKNGDMARIQSCITDEMRKRQRAATAVLGNMDVQLQFGGYNLWVVLPPHASANRLANHLAEQGVVVRVASDFASHQPHNKAELPNALRLSLSAPQRFTDVERGLRLITQAYAHIEQHAFVV
ncbi:aminotransferase-like domain-containing protein [Flocculibacter collagenilyticus]|uniref:aminotransferase-like domain-containing protein n=1 Tax=Flocculibacter collagenilyticus TaxID=2744479 RepID=UPI0018F45D6B|nr:PLP-dependent aminotransferase family protein [Flocculibacter collagenilyticus]